MIATVRFPDTITHDNATPPPRPARRRQSPTHQRYFAPGDIVAGKYEILGVLGEGGMGVVYEARHLHIPGRRCALKFARTRDPERRARALARFRREIQVGALLAGRGVVQIFDADTLDDGRPFIVMERASGQSLKMRLRAGALPWREAFRIAHQVALTLADAHQKGVIHRDIKPANIFLCDDGSVLVLDFGVAHVTGNGAPARLTSTGQSVGTPAYMSPEQAMCRSDLDGRADIYALGATLYEAITGVSLFALGRSRSDAIRCKMEQPPTVRALRSEMPADVAAVIDTAVAVDRTLRFGDMAACAAALHASLNRSRSSTDARSPHRRTIALTACAAAIIGLFATVAAQRLASSEPTTAPTKLSHSRQKDSLKWIEKSH